MKWFPSTQRANHFFNEIHFRFTINGENNNGCQEEDKNLPKSPGTATTQKDVKLSIDAKVKMNTEKRKKTPGRKKKPPLSMQEKTVLRLESNERERNRMHGLNQAFQVGTPNFYIVMSRPKHSYFLYLWCIGLV